MLPVIGLFEKPIGRQDVNRMSKPKLERINTNPGIQVRCAMETDILLEAIWIEKYLLRHIKAYKQTESVTDCNSDGFAVNTIRRLVQAGRRRFR
jgi:hypothetical protein